MERFLDQDAVLAKLIKAEVEPLAIPMHESICWPTGAGCIKLLITFLITVS